MGRGHSYRQHHRAVRGGANQVPTPVWGQGEGLEGPAKVFSCPNITKVSLDLR